METTITAESIGISNALEAIDQVASYESLADAFAAYEQNTLNSAREVGVSWEDASDAFWSAVERLAFVDGSEPCPYMGTRDRWVLR